MAAADSVDDHLAQVPEPQRATLQELRETIRGLVPIVRTRIAEIEAARRS